MKSLYWHICLEVKEEGGRVSYVLLEKLNYDRTTPSSEEGLSRISKMASQYPALKLIVFRELPITIIITSEVEE